MAFWLYWMSIAALCFILEIFLFTLDFLAVGISAIITGLIVYIFDLTIDQRWITAIVFGVISVILLIISRFYILPYMQSQKWPSQPMSIDQIIGQKIVVQKKDNQLVIFNEWTYWIIDTKDKIKPGDTVEVVSMKNNKAQVKKVM